MSVKDVSTGSTIAGWLFDFGIDSHTPRSDHRVWLETRVVLPLQLESIRAGQGRDARAARLGSGHWQIWIVGAASRTAGYKHNWALSKRRAQSIRDYIARRMVKVDLSCDIKLVAASEVPALLFMGRADEIENAFDRSVLVVAYKVLPGVKAEPKPLVRLPETSFVRLYLYVERFDFVLFSKGSAELYAVYYDSSHCPKYDGWMVSFTEKSKSLTDLVKSRIKLWSGLGEFFYGPARAVYPSPKAAAFLSPKALDLLNNKTIQVGLEGRDIWLIIEKAGFCTGFDDNLHLTLPSLSKKNQIEIPAVSVGIGSIGQRKPLSSHVVRWLEGNLTGGCA